MRSHALIPVAAAVAACSLLAAGCGGGSATTATRTTAQTGALAFARCMRSHGIAGWPDPSPSGGFDKSRLRQLGYTKSRVLAAEEPCGHLLPSSRGGSQETVQQTRTRLADALAFARCVRARGLPGFPDPNTQGELTPAMVTAAGIDLHQPNVLRAGLACVSVTHGLLTRAAIERAVHGG